jgi:deoxyribose-phosphate aldolase
MGFLVHICTYLKMKFASVTSDAFFNVLKSVKKTAYNVLLKTFKELGKLNSMTMTEAVKISTKFALTFLKNKTINILN